MSYGKSGKANQGIKLKLIGWRPCTELYVMFGGKCQSGLSDCPMGGRVMTFEETTYDHIHPFSERATYTKTKSVNDVENLVIMCGTCNRRKATKSAENFFGASNLERIMSTNSKRLASELIESAAPAIANEKPWGKYARLAVGGRYYRPELAPVAA